MSPSPLPHPPDGYLDALGGSPLLPSAARALAAAADTAWADPARLHHLGRTAGLVLDAARDSIAGWLGVRPAQVHLASSVQAALSYGLQGLLAPRPHGAIALSAVESLTLLEAADASGRTLELLPVDSRGRLDLDAVPTEQSWSVACLQAANPEVGTIQPVAELAARLEGSGTALLMDATGCVGHMALQPGASALAASARDWGGPAGLGILVLAPGTNWSPPAGSQRGWLGGFPDVAAAASGGIAAEVIASEWKSEAVRAHRAIDRVRESIASSIPDVEIVGDPVDRLPHVLTFSALYCSGEALVTELDRRGFAVASGSACTSDTERPSHVLAAMGALTGGNVRISLPYGFTDETVDRFLQALPEVVESLRADVGL